ncbi:hypothetical protein VP01_432g1 [Puccinia sorghi]|uniref:Uncharacterized protein n=1 Tax=Puccinia sorghi TaxID=27349 RepID=A0A0L6UPZ1_9BASI|nr:hypothetical protein VP01_432g1 [Puccinia sorghi]
MWSLDCSLAGACFMSTAGKSRGEKKGKETGEQKVLVYESTSGAENHIPLTSIGPRPFEGLLAAQITKKINEALRFAKARVDQEPITVRACILIKLGPKKV